MIGDNKTIQNKEIKCGGYSLVEILVSVTIFATLIILVTNVFQNAVDGQRSAIAAQNTQENMRYTMEVISKEFRSALRSDNTGFVLPGYTDNIVYNLDNSGSWGAVGDILYFKNKNNEDTYYFLANDTLKVRRIGLIHDYVASTTPDETKISNLSFSVNDNLVGSDPSGRIQPKVTIRMSVESVGGKETLKQTLEVQTTISSRSY